MAIELTVEQRRTAFVVSLSVAALAFVLAIGVTLAAIPSAGTWLIVATIVLVLALGTELFLLVYGESKEFDEDGEWYDWESEAAGGHEILLRCSNCQETFGVLDTGERPLRHSCPHCGRSGVLKERPPPVA